MSLNEARVVGILKWIVFFAMGLGELYPFMGRVDTERNLYIFRFDDFAFERDFDVGILR